MFTDFTKRRQANRQTTAHTLNNRSHPDDKITAYTVDNDTGMESIGPPPTGGSSVRMPTNNAPPEQPANTPQQPAPGQSPGPPQNRSKYGAVPVVLPVKIGTSQIFIEERSPGTFYDIYWLYRITDDPAIVDIIQILDSATADTTVIFYLSGPGGAADVAARVISAMQTTAATVKTYAAGECASSSALMWAYGHERYVEPGSCVMFHMSSHGDQGNTENVYDSALVIQKYIRGIMLDPKIRGPVLHEDEITALTEDRRDIFLDAETLVSRGIFLHEPKGDRHDG